MASKSAINGWVDSGREIVSSTGPVLVSVGGRAGAGGMIVSVEGRAGGMIVSVEGRAGAGGMIVSVERKAGGMNVSCYE